MPLIFPARPGGTANVLEILGREGINIEYFSAFIGSVSESFVIFRVENCEEAMKILRRTIFMSLTEKVYAL